MADLLGRLFTTEAMARATGGRALLEAMLRVEAALARAEAACAVIPPEAAAAVAAACNPDDFDLDALAAATAAAGNPVIPLVDELARRAGDWVHWGATSQDVLDTALVLVARDGVGLLVADLQAVAAELAALADRHRATLMLGRTLLQPAVPITFGLKAAGWLDQVTRVTAHLRAADLPVQLGGAAGTLSVLGGRGPAVVAALAAELGLAEPALPWHTAPDRLARLATDLAVTAGAVAKITGDVALLMQAEVGEVAEGVPGGSSAMPHKRNPLAGPVAGACARRAAALAGVMVGAMVQEHERAVGAWQAEWPSLPDLLRATAGAVGAARVALGGLQVDEVRMRANLDATRGLVLAEAAAAALTPSLGRAEARRRVSQAADRLRAGAHDALGDALGLRLDPAEHLGAADAFIDRALAAHRRLLEAHDPGNRGAGPRER